MSGSYEVRFQNVKVLVDSDLDDDNSWVNYTDVFAENNFPYDISQPGLSPEKIDAVNHYKAYYGDVSYGKNGINDVGYGMSDVEKQINVIYRVKLVDNRRNKSKYSFKMLGGNLGKNHIFRQWYNCRTMFVYADKSRRNTG